LELRAKLAIIGIPSLLTTIGILAGVNFIKLSDLSSIVASALVSGMIGLAVWGFRPKEKFDKASYEKELRDKEAVENKLHNEKAIREFRMAGSLSDTDDSTDK